jgi:hypothetical protein
VWYLVGLGRRIWCLKRRNLLFAFFASTSLGLSAVTTALADSTIVVDGSMAVTQSDSGDDLATLQNIFQDANAPAEPAMDQLKQIMADVKMKRMRILQSDIYCDVDSYGNFGTNQNGVFVPGDCYPLAWHLRWALDNGLSPHAAVAAFMPPSFAQSGPAETWDAPTLDRYRVYAERLVHYIATTAFDGGAQSVVFEISNELDIADSAPENWNRTDPSVYALKPLGSWGRWLWWMKPSYQLHQWPQSQAHVYPYGDDAGLAYPYGTDIRRLDRQISPIHKIFADKINAVRSQFGSNPNYAGKTIEIAGPAFAGLSFSFNFGFPTLEEGFLDQILNSQIAGGKFNSELDRFSFHYYGSNIIYVPTESTAPFASLKLVTDKIKAKLDALGHRDIKLFISEWGPTVDEGTDINYSHKGAAWAAAFLTEAVAEKIAMGSYLIVGDGLTDPNRPSVLGQASLMHKNVAGDGSIQYYPKPVANVFKMFAKMTGKRRPVTLSTTDTNSNLGAFATSDTSSASVVVFNYNSTLVFNNNNNTLQDTPETITLRLDNLPFNDGAVTLQRYQVDANTSNLNAFLNSPNHPDPSLQMVEQTTAQVQNRQLTLPRWSLGLGVTLWQVSL